MVAALLIGDTISRLDALQGQVDDVGVENPFADLTADQEECVETRGESGFSELALGAASDPSAAGDAQRVEMFSLLIECVPNLDELDAFVEIVTHNLDSALGAGARVDTVEGRCVLSYVLDNAVDPADALSTASTLDSVTTFQDAFGECLDPESLAFVLRTAGSGPQSYGDDPDLDALYEGCDQGDEQACDLLFYLTTDGSEYRNLAVDCAGRGDGLSYCVPGMEVDDEGRITVDSIGLTTLESACLDGVMIACDLLFLSAPLGSDFERVGFTCGDRIAVGAVPDCRSRFPE